MGRPRRAGRCPGDEGPGGGYAPSPEADWHLMVGDDAALPAIAVSLLSVPSGVPALAVVEVSGPEHHQPLDCPGNLDVLWLHRSRDAGSDHAPMLEAVRGLSLPDGHGQAFVHGEATAVRAVRRHLVLERGLPIEALSASGYWKLRRTDEQWRAEKREWMAQPRPTSTEWSPPSGFSASLRTGGARAHCSVGDVRLQCNWYELDEVPRWRFWRRRNHSRGW